MQDSAADLLREKPSEEFSADRFMAPADCPHYQDGPVATRSIELKGLLWAVTYHAEHDGTGWRVHRCEARQVEAPGHTYARGELVPVMLRIVEDAGPRIKFRSEGPGEMHTFWGWRSQIAPPRP